MNANVERPDMLDLNDWAAVHAPAVYNVAKYLSDTDAFTRVLFMAWKEAGCPDLNATQIG